MRLRGSLQQLVVCLLMALATVNARAQTGTFIDRLLPTDLRMVSYNVLWDSIFPDRDATKAAKFSRVVNALNPDILNLQEIGDPFTQGWTPKTGVDVRNLLNNIVPLSGGASWNVYMGGDAVIASKYPLSLTRNNTSPTGDKPQAMALVDLPNDQFPTDFYIINSHFKCCNTEGNEDERRQRQSDSIVNWFRDAKTPGGFINLPPGTPFALVGDLNTVGSASVLNTVVTGNIVNEGIYGSDSPPDWDGTSLTDAHPLHNNTGTDFYTYRSGNTKNLLDYVIYSDSALDVGRKFVLNTYDMTSTQRTAAGLQRFDTAQGSSSTWFDHLPVVVDFRIFDFSESDFNYSRTVDATDLATWQSNYGLASGATRAQGDANADGQINGRDFLTWQRQATASVPTLAAVPEPASFTMLIGALGIVMGFVRMGRR
jgi:endonuclease/exonuclease/phosphatase family metal-dependent hydrolase